MDAILPVMLCNEALTSGHRGSESFLGWQFRYAQSQHIQDPWIKDDERNEKNPAFESLPGSLPSVCSFLGLLSVMDHCCGNGSFQTPGDILDDTKPEGSGEPLSLQLMTSERSLGTALWLCT